jgi:hypothetical protein
MEEENKNVIPGEVGWVVGEEECLGWIECEVDCVANLFTVSIFHKTF